MAARQTTIYDMFGGRPIAIGAAESKRAGDKEYDKAKRRRVFQQSWKENRLWLRYDEDSGAMFCTVCKANTHGFADKSSSFVQGGAKSLQLCSVQKHENSAKHKKEHEACTAEESSAELPAEKMLRHLGERRRNMMCIKFRNAHALAKKHRPYSDFVWMNTMDSLKGLDVGDTHEYASDKQAATFCHHIAEVEREVLKKQVSEAGFVSILMDGSTDVSVVEDEMVYVRLCEAGEICVKFVGIIATPKADADGITNSLKTAIKNGLELTLTDLGKKLVAMGTDGASVMFGCNNGVVKKVRDQAAPSMVGVHCFAHRLELAAKDIVKEHPMYAEFEQLLKDLFRMYKKSPLNRSGLKKACKKTKVKNLVPTRVGGTRWIGHTLKAMNNLWHIYPAIVLHLSQVMKGGQSDTTKGLATNLHGKLTRKSVVCFGHFLWDIVTTLARLSLALQSRNRSVAEVSDLLDAEVAVLQKWKSADKNGPKLTKVQEQHQLDGVTFVDEVSGRRRQNVPLTVIKGNICTGLITNLTNRFEMSDEMITATRLADKKTWPKDDKASGYSEFGDDYIDTLVRHFAANLENAGVQVDLISEEWTKLKRVLYKRHPSTLNSMTWQSINRQYGSLAPNFLKLVDLILTIPATTAEAERGFSQLKLMKTDQRNRLKEPSMNVLLRIRLLSPTIDEFDPLPAVEHWNYAINRRKAKPKSANSLEVHDADSDSESELESEEEDLNELLKGMPEQGSDNEENENENDISDGESEESESVVEVESEESADDCELEEVDASGSESMEEGDTAQPTEPIRSDSSEVEEEEVSDSDNDMMQQEEDVAKPSGSDSSEVEEKEVSDSDNDMMQQEDGGAKPSGSDSSEVEEEEVSESEKYMMQQEEDGAKPSGSDSSEVEEEKVSDNVILYFSDSEGGDTA